MRLQPIDDPEDPRIEAYRSLKEADLVLRRGLFVAEGVLVVERLLRATRFRARSLLLTEPRLQGLEEAIEASGQDPLVHVVSRSVMDQIVGFPIHRGCLALGERAAPQEARALLAAARTVVVLLGLSNHDNVGSIFRSALALGAEAILIDRETADPLYRKAIRVSMGTVLDLPFVSMERPAILEALRQAGFARWALTPAADAAVLTPGQASPERLALLLGAEGEGLSPEAQAAADLRVRVPMVPGVDSLNAAVAGAVVLGMLGRMRAPPAGPPSGPKYT
ncbi:MAG: RNA methyltransferase [Myxococcota bacterium]